MDTVIITQSTTILIECAIQKEKPMSKLPVYANYVDKSMQAICCGVSGLSCVTLVILCYDKCIDYCVT